MLKISVINGSKEIRVVLEGKLIAPWVAELRRTCERVRAELHPPELVIDMQHVMMISQEGENALLQLMNEGARFRCRDVFTKHVLKQIARRASRNPQEANR